MPFLRSLVARGLTTVAAHWRALVVSVAVLALTTTGGVVAWSVAEPVPLPAATQGEAATAPSPSSSPTPSETESASALEAPPPETGDAEQPAPEEKVAPPVAAPAPAPAAPAPAPPVPAPAPAPPAPAPVAPTAVYVAEVLQLVNVERANVGLAPLAMSASLNSSAAAHASWMAANNNFSHGALPTGWNAAGENIAKGQPTAASVVAAWMNSEGHKANILRASFTHMGLGYVASGNWWCQQFGG